LKRAFASLPPAGLHLVLPISAALLLRVSFKAFLIAWGLFELLSIPLAPAGYAIGRALLESDALYSFWRIVTHLPVLAPMGYSRYLLLGTTCSRLAWPYPPSSRCGTWFSSTAAPSPLGPRAGGRSGALGETA